MVLISGSILAVLLIIGMISGSATLITAYWRDVKTKEYEAEIVIDQNQTIEEMMKDDSIPDEEKGDMLMKYFGMSAPSSFGDFGELAKYIPVLVGGYVAAAMLGGRR